MGHTPPWTQVPVSNIRFKGVFDYDGLMQLVYDWMDRRKFKIIEKIYKHKGGAAGWEFERELEGTRKVTDYIKYVITVAIHTWDTKEVEVIKDGKKMKLNKGRLEIKMNIGIELDYAGRWESSEAMEKVRNFFHSYIIKKEIAFKHADPLYYGMLALHTSIKKFLAMEGATSAYPQP